MTEQHTCIGKKWSIYVFRIGCISTRELLELVKNQWIEELRLNNWSPEDLQQDLERKKNRTPKNMCMLFV
jgi:hypothetical protein